MSFDYFFRVIVHTLHLSPVEPGRPEEVVLDGVEAGAPMGGRRAGRRGQQRVRVACTCKTTIVRVWD